MRKTAAILLIFVFGFNLFGYRLLYNYLALRTDASIENLLDEERYADNELLSIKRPLQLPYYNNSGKFDRISGEVEIEGMTYRFVKYRIYNDSVEMLCIPHAQKTKLNQVRDGYAASNAEAGASSERRNGSGGKYSQPYWSDYEECLIRQLDHPIMLNDRHYMPAAPVIYASSYCSSEERPPESFRS